jgi:hypothetical protein
MEELPAEIVFNIYSFMEQKERSRLRRTCKYFYLMFNLRSSQNFCSLVKDRLTVLLGISLVEKLAARKTTSFGIPVLRTPWEEPDKIFFHIDPRCSTLDNFRMSFLSGAGGQTLTYINTRYNIKPDNTYVIIKRKDGESLYTCGLFKFPGCPENPLWKDNIDFVSRVLVDVFFMFSSRHQYKSPSKMLNYQLADLIEKIVDSPDVLRYSLFEIFNKSSIVSDLYYGVYKDAPETHHDSKPKNKYIYQSFVDEMIYMLRKELKAYFYDGKDARSCIYSQ